MLRVIHEIETVKVKPNPFLQFVKMGEGVAGMEPESQETLFMIS